MNKLNNAYIGSKLIIITVIIFIIILSLTGCMKLVKPNDASANTDSTPVTTQTPEVKKHKGFTVSGTQLLDANGNVFIMRGVNHAHTWYKGYLTTAIQAITNAGANTVRIVLSNGDKWSKDDTNSVKEIISLCEENKLIAVLEVHDPSGSNEEQPLLNAANYFISIKDALVGKEDRVIINIANEWYGDWNSKKWAEGYIKAIPVIRNAGLRHTIMVDSAGWGQFALSVQGLGKDVFNADSERNTMFSVHMYEYAGSDAKKIKDNIDGVLAEGLALCIGEFGFKHTSGDVDEATIMSYANEKNIGWLAWSWKGNSGGVEYLDLSSNWEGTDLNDWGNTIVNGPNGLKETSKRCTIFD